MAGDLEMLTRRALVAGQYDAPDKLDLLDTVALEVLKGQIIGEPERVTQNGYAAAQHAYATAKSFLRVRNEMREEPEP